uniref:Histone-lysine N-methyltransferase n=1 Tax=Macrostomum lignano TaxID=282301 RepID=A0A1I8FSA2_9PLAT
GQPDGHHDTGVAGSPADHQADEDQFSADSPTVQSGQRNGVSTLSGNVMRSLTCLLGLDFNSQLEQLIHRNKKHRLNSARDSARPAIAAPPPVPPARRHAEDAVTVSSLISAKQPVVCARCDLPISSAVFGCAMPFESLKRRSSRMNCCSAVRIACRCIRGRSPMRPSFLVAEQSASDDWLGIAGELRPQLYVGDDDQPTSVSRLLLQPSAPGNRARQHLLDRPPSQALGATIIGIRAAAAAGLVSPASIAPPLSSLAATAASAQSAGFFGGNTSSASAAAAAAASAAALSRRRSLSSAASTLDGSGGIGGGLSESSGGGGVPTKKWKGLRCWRKFGPDFRPAQEYRPMSETEIEELKKVELQAFPFLLPSPASLPSRPGHEGASRPGRLPSLRALLRGWRPSGRRPGRLLNLDAGRWVHLNCALWCFDVYETVSGGLVNVDIWVQQALGTLCSHCGRLGAGLVCYRPKCPAVYHLACALKSQLHAVHRPGACTAPRTGLGSITCSCTAWPLFGAGLHQQGRGLRYGRVAAALLSPTTRKKPACGLDRLNCTVLASCCRLRLPAASSTAAGTSTPSATWPPGIYWSCRYTAVRCRYLCRIDEREGAPEFSVTVSETGHPDESFTSNTCDGVWRPLLTRIHKLRSSAGLINMFPDHITGEDLYGLTEPNICAQSSLCRAWTPHASTDSVPQPGVTRRSPPHRIRISPYSSRASSPARLPCAIGAAPYSKQYSHSKSSQYKRLLRHRVAAECLLGPVRIQASACSPLGPWRSTPWLSTYIGRLQAACAPSAQAECSTWRRSRIQGLGLSPLGTFGEALPWLSRYIGEVIRNEIANKSAQKLYESQVRFYPFEITVVAEVGECVTSHPQNRGIYMFRLDDDWIVDATICGGPARYINHSCQPNCSAEVVDVDRGRKIIILANRRVEKGEELTYDYKFDFEDSGSKIPCLCGAPHCRKWMN